MFLLVVAAGIFLESWIRLFDPPSVDGHRLLPISIAGLVVNLIGMYAFRNGAGLDHSHIHDNANIRGLFGRILLANILLYFTY
jgi:zinc transporter 5/7